MRALYIPLAVLAGILLLSLGSGAYVAGRTGLWQEMLLQADELAEEERWADALTQLQRSYDSWTESQTLFHIILRHDELDEAESLFARAFADCDQQDVPDFHSAMGELHSQLSLLAETQMISIKNIL